MIAVEELEAPPVATTGRTIFLDSQIEAIIRFVRLCETMPVDQAWRIAMGCRFSRGIKTNALLK